MIAIPRWLLVLGLCCAAVGCAAGAGDPATFAIDRERAVQATVRAFCHAVDALKPAFPELAGFDTPECMQTGEGWVFYDASKAAKAGKPGQRVGIFMRIPLAGAKEPPAALERAFPWKVSGYLAVGGSEGLKQEVFDAYYDARRHVLDPGMAEAVLKRAGVHEGMDAWLAAAEIQAGGGRWIDEVVPEISYQRGFRPTIAGRVFVALRDATLSTDQWERILAGLRDRRYPPDAWFEILALLHKEGPDRWPGRSVEIARMLVDVERERADALAATPFFGTGWVGMARDMRMDMTQEIGRSSDVRFLPAARFVVKNDPVADFRQTTFACVDTMDPRATRDLVREALANGMRSMVVRAEDYLSRHPRLETIAALKKLAVSPVVRVRETAARALHAAGFDAPDAPAHFVLPDGAKRMVATLRGLGLDDALILQVLSHPATDRIGEGGPGKPAKVTPLEDQWRIESLNEASVGKRARQYRDGFGLHRLFFRIDPTGPYLLAAAPQDERTQRLIYEGMGEAYENDDDALQQGIDYLAWSIFQRGLDAFQRTEDGKAAEAFERMKVFAPYAKPNSELSVWLRQSRTLREDLRRRRAETAAGPEPAGTAERIAYWVKRIPEINGFQTTQPGRPSIWREQNPPSEDAGYRPNLPFASDKLREIGLAAVPALVERVDDATPTRTIGYWRGYDPYQYWVTVGEAARQIIGRICADHHLEPPYAEPYSGNPARLGDVWGRWLATLQAAGKLPGGDRVDIDSR